MHIHLLFFQWMCASPGGGHACPSQEVGLIERRFLSLLRLVVPYSSEWSFGEGTGRRASNH